MQRLEQHIEKRFGNGIHYRYNRYIQYRINECYMRGQNILVLHRESTGEDIIISINDLCSPECTFLQSLEFKSGYGYWIIDAHMVNTKRTADMVEFHRIQLSLLNDEQKILYIINNTK